MENTEKELKRLFDDVDTDKSGKISFKELHKALKRGQPNSQFEKITVKLIITRFDANNDGEIDFDEFVLVYDYLTEQFEEFLMIDEDMNGTIEVSELEKAMNAKGHELSRKFYEFIVETVKTFTLTGITFDNYCRIEARFCQLYKDYSAKVNGPLEMYLMKNFFLNFW